MSRPKKTTYRVFFAQVNAMYIDVRAVWPDEAEAKARRIWRRDHGHTYVDAIETAPVEPRPALAGRKARSGSARSANGAKRTLKDSGRKAATPKRNP